MVEITERMHRPEAIGQQKSNAQWIGVFAHYFVTQQHVRITTPEGATKESVVIGVNHDSVTAAAIYGANQLIPFASIETVQRIGTAEVLLDPHVTRDVDQFVGYMARGEYLRLETVHGVIAQAVPRWLTLSGVQVIDAANDRRISVPFGDITQVTAAS